MNSRVQATRRPCILLRSRRCRSLLRRRTLLPVCCVSPCRALVVAVSGLPARAQAHVTQGAAGVAVRHGGHVGTSTLASSTSELFGLVQLHPVGRLLVGRSADAGRPMRTINMPPGMAHQRLVSRRRAGAASAVACRPVGAAIVSPRCPRLSGVGVDRVGAAQPDHRFAGVRFVRPIPCRRSDLGR